MSLLDRLKSYCKVPFRYCRIVYYLLKYHWRILLLILVVLTFLWYIFGFLITFFLCCLFLLYLVYESCDLLLYNPDQPKDSRTNVLTPGRFGFFSFETHFINTEDNVHIHVMLLKRPSIEECVSAPTLVYFHGNAGNIGYCVANAIEISNKIKCNVLLVEYRGYGFSKGKPSEAGLYKDAHAALNFLHQRNDICKSKIVLLGRSLGGAVALGVTCQMITSSATKNLKVAALIIENTFTSIPDISRFLFTGNSKTCLARTFRLIPRWFYKNRYESYQKVSKVTLPTLFLSGLADELIPPEMMTRLFHCSSAPYKELHKFETGSHNFTYKCAQYYTTIDSFLSTIFNCNDLANPVTPFLEQSSFENADHSLDEKSPLIVEYEHEDSNLLPPKSVVMYHPEEAKSLDPSNIVNCGEINNHILYMLDSGINPVLITMENQQLTDLVNI